MEITGKGGGSEKNIEMSEVRERKMFAIYDALSERYVSPRRVRTAIKSIS